MRSDTYRQMIMRDEHTSAPATKGNERATIVEVLSCKCKRNLTFGVALGLLIGTGTAAVVAEGLGRCLIGFELNSRYAAIARKRLACT